MLTHKVLMPVHRTFHLVVCVAIAVAAASQPAWGQDVRLEFDRGLVTLDARNVPVREILRLWAQVGRVDIVNLDAVTSRPVTMQLVQASEHSALASLLRESYGFLLTSRRPVAGSLAVFDLIIVAVPGAGDAARRAQDASSPVARDAGQGNVAGRTFTEPPPTPSRGLEALFTSMTESDELHGGIPEPAPFVAPIPPTPRITDMPLGTAVPSSGPSAKPGPPVPENPFGITTASDRPGTTAPPPPPPDGITFRSGGDIVEGTPQP